MPLSSPFDHCVPGVGVGHASWIVEALAGRSGVAFVVPDRYDRCVRVHHPLNDQRWADLAPEYLRRGVELYDHPFPYEVGDVEGDLGELAVDRLSAILGVLDGSDQACHYGLWTGWGGLRPGSSTAVFQQAKRSPWGRWRSRRMARRARREEREFQRPIHDFVSNCPVMEWWGGRSFCLFDGPLRAERTIGISWPSEDGALLRRSPQWWWPIDRSWFVATEIDFPWTYVAGPGALADAVLDEDSLETVEVEFTDRW